MLIAGMPRQLNTKAGYCLYRHRYIFLSPKRERGLVDDAILVWSIWSGAIKPFYYIF